MNPTFRERVKQGFIRSSFAPQRERELFVRMIDCFDEDGQPCKTPVSYKPESVDGLLFSVDNLMKSGNTDLLRPSAGIQPTLFQSVDSIPDDFVLTPAMLNPQTTE